MISALVLCVIGVFGDKGECFNFDPTLQVDLFDPGLIVPPCPDGSLINPDAIGDCLAAWQPLYDSELATATREWVEAYRGFVFAKNIWETQFDACDGDAACEYWCNLRMCAEVKKYKKDVDTVKQQWAYSRFVIQQSFETCILGYCVPDTGGGCWPPQDWPDNPYSGSPPANMPPMPDCDDWWEECKQQKLGVYLQDIVTAQDQARQGHDAAVMALQIAIFNCYAENLGNCMAMLACINEAWSNFDAMAAAVAAKKQGDMQAALDKFVEEIGECCKDR